MGLYAGNWLRGTRVVVASIGPVPDEWMPILSVLTMHGTVATTCCRCRRRWRKASSRLRSGDMVRRQYGVRRGRD